MPKLAKFDKRRLQQILLNLLSNAVKYSKVGEILVTAKIQRSEGCEMLIIAVKDEGVGFKLEDIPKVFQPFPDFGHKASSSPHISNGVGLSVCK